MNNLKKKCQYCKTEIDNDCYKCPNCREWVDPYRLAKDNPLIKKVIFIFFLLILAFVGPRLFINKSLKKYEIETFTSAKEHKLKVINDKILSNGNNKSVIASVINEGQQVFNSLTIEARFYNKNKELVRINNTYLSGSLPPGKERPFQITFNSNCSGESKSEPAFETYELEILDGFINNKK